MVRKSTYQLPKVPDLFRRVPPGATPLPSTTPLRGASSQSSGGPLLNHLCAARRSTPRPPATLQEIGDPPMHFVTLTDHQVATLLQNAKLRANDVLGGESRARERPVKIVSTEMISVAPAALLYANGLSCSAGVINLRRSLVRCAEARCLGERRKRGQPSRCGASDQSHCRSVGLKRRATP